MISPDDSQSGKPKGKAKSRKTQASAPAGNLVPFAGNAAPLASAKPPASAPRAKSLPQFGPGNPVPLAVKMAVRSFYLIQGLKPAQIGPMVGLSSQQISALARREGWSTGRKGKPGRSEQKAVELQDSRAGVEVEKIHEAIAMRGEELAVGTLELAAERLRSKDDKGLQMVSGAALNFTKIARMSRGLDARGVNSGGSGAVLAVNLFLVRGETPETMKQAAAIPVEAKAVSSQ